MKIQVAVLTFVVGLATVAYQGCGGIHENPGSVDSLASFGNLSAADKAGAAAFQTGFYSFAKTQGCVKCHGNFQAPKFADADVVSAYFAFKPLVNTADPTNSLIVTYAGNGHCADAVCSDPLVRPRVQSLLQSYASAVNAAGGGGEVVKYITDTLAMPATIPALNAAPAVMRFPLSKFGIPELSKAILEIEVNNYNTTEYKIGRVKIMGNTAVITVKSIHVYVKASTVLSGIGIEDASQGMGWSTLDVSIPVSTLPTTLPTTPLTATPLATTALGIVHQSATDMITVGIDDIIVSNAQVRFQDLVSTSKGSLGVFGQSCVSCHSGGTPSAGLDLTNYAATTAKAAAIVTRMTSATAPMPPSGLLPVTSSNLVKAWVSASTPQ